MTPTKTLVPGSKGAPVLQLQRALIKHGHDLEADGHYGPQTTTAVANQQRKHGLVIDGIYGPKTAQTLSSNPNTQQLLTHADLTQAAKQLGVPLAAIMAVSSVESAGSGFIGSQPRILFERHVFYRQLKKHGLAASQLEALTQAHPHLINATPGGYQGGNLEHQRLQAAKRLAPPLSEQAAAEACSWGLYQIMGYHWQALGYPSLQEFLHQMHQGEAGHLEAFTRFILADKHLHQALQQQNWADFAKRYNGPNYAQNLYDTKLARAFANFSQLHPEQPQPAEKTTPKKAKK